MRFSILLLLTSFIFLGKLNSQRDTIVTDSTERVPVFPGGPEEMERFVYSEIKYPEEAKKNKIHGQVIMQFVVGEEGEIRDIKLVRGLGYGCDEEATRVMEVMKENYRWTPGLHKGHPVPVKFTLPMMFMQR